MAFFLHWYGKGAYPLSQTDEMTPTELQFWHSKVIDQLELERKEQDAAANRARSRSGRRG